MKRELNLRLGTPIEREQIPRTTRTKSSIYRPILEEILEKSAELHGYAVPILGFTNASNVIHGLNQIIKAMDVPNVRVIKRDEQVFLIIE